MGNARTAFFNWIYARKLGGAFILRVEDTDASRSDEEHIVALAEILEWLGIGPDEGPFKGGATGPYRQSQRTEIHQNEVAALIESGHAFWSPAQRGEVKRFDDRWRDKGLSKEEGDAIAPSALRLRAPKADTIVIEDLLKGHIKLNAKQIGDFTLARTDSTPLYNLACVIDDHHMGITHVVRGEDHLTNTAKQILLYKAFDWPPPAFLHLPLVLGPDGSPLSKRHGDVSVEAFREQGFVPEALLNALAMLGWGPGDDRELFTKEEIVPLFDVERLSTSPARFFPKKLKWFNGQHIRRMDSEDLAERLRCRLAVEGIDVDGCQIQPLLPAIQDRLRSLEEAPALVGPFFRPPCPTSTIEMLQSMDIDALPRLEELALFLEGWEGVWDSELLESALEPWREEKGWDAKALWQPLRVALMGGKVSPPIFDTLALLGQEESLNRLSSLAS